WDENKVKISPNQLREILRNGSPSIETVGNNQEVGITTWMMVPGHETIVAEKIQSILKEHAV
ncbi:MAG: selenocysteine synthase, partial [Flavobacteriaceae bacterium]